MVFVSVVCLAFLLMPSVNGSYWLLTDLSTQLYMMMYVLMFFAALIICYKYAGLSKRSIIPFGKAGYWLTCLLGIIGCTITIVVGFFPPAGINVGGPIHYEVSFVSGIILMLLPATLFYGYKYYGRFPFARRATL